MLEVSPTNAGAIGDAVFNSLANFSWDNSGVLPDWETYPKYVLEVGGFRTWSEYEQGLEDCIVKKERDCFHIYTERPHILLAIDVTADQIGEAVLKALGTSVANEQRRAELRRHRSQHDE